MIKIIILIIIIGIYCHITKVDPKLLKKIVSEAEEIIVIDFTPEDAIKLTEEARKINEYKELKSEAMNVIVHEIIPQIKDEAKKGINCIEYEKNKYLFKTIEFILNSKGWKVELKIEQTNNMLLTSPPQRAYREFMAICWYNFENL